MKNPLHETVEFDFENNKCFEMSTFSILSIDINKQDLITSMHTYLKCQAIIYYMCDEV